MSAFLLYGDRRGCRYSSVMASATWRTPRGTGRALSSSAAKFGRKRCSCKPRLGSLGRRTKSQGRMEVREREPSQLPHRAGGDLRLTRTEVATGRRLTIRRGCDMLAKLCSTRSRWLAVAPVTIAAVLMTATSDTAPNLPGTAARATHHGAVA